MQLLQARRAASGLVEWEFDLKAGKMFRRVPFDTVGG
jgi:hypothetical protein